MAPIKRPIRPLNKPPISFSFPTGSSQPPPKPRQPKFNTLTTRGRIAKAHHTAKLEKAKPDGVSSAPDPDPPSKKSASVPQSVDKAAASNAKNGNATGTDEAKAPPKKRQRALFGRPEDMEAEMEAAKALKEKKARDKKKPKNTKSIIRDVKAKEARVAKAKERAEAKKAGGDGNEGKGKERGKQGKNLMGLMWEMKLMGSEGKGQAGSPSGSKGTTDSGTIALSGHGFGEDLLVPQSNISEKGTTALSVLVRPTARALRQRREMRKNFDLSEIWRKAEAHDPKLKGMMMFQNVKGGNGANEQTADAKPAKMSTASAGASTGQIPAQSGQPQTTVYVNGRCFLLEIPAELRTKTIKLAVTDTRYFVDPLSPTGAEQPDLAMTCRQLRNDVLPIYYGSNVFVIEVLSQLEVGSAAELYAQKKASRQKEKQVQLQRWLNMLTNRGYLALVRHWAFDCVPPPERYIAALPPVRSSSTQALGTSSQAYGASIIVALDFPCPVAGVTQTPQVQIHRSAACLLSGLLDGAPCSTRSGEHAALLAADVAGMMNEGVDRAKVVVETAKTLGLGWGGLGKEQCVVGESE